MSQATSLLENLQSSGVKIFVNNGKLKIDAPMGELSTETLEALRVHKSEIISRLTQPFEDDTEERLAIMEFDGQPSEVITQNEPDPSCDFCAACGGKLYQKGVQWECPTTGCFESRTRGMR